MAPPLEDEEPGAVGDAGTGQEEDRGGVLKEEIKEAETQRKERGPLGDRFGVQT